jgi:hypothetical protein
LSEQTVEVLCENIGVTTLMDLLTVYNDSVILADLENYLRRLDYLKFVKVKDETVRILGAAGIFLFSLIHFSGITFMAP